MNQTFRVVLCLILWLPVVVPAQPTTWQSLADRLPGLSEDRLHQLQQTYTVWEVEPDMLKLVDRQTGMIRYVDIHDHEFDFDNPPSNVQVIDLPNTDTTLYNWKYTRQPGILLVGGRLGYPMVIEDLDGNGSIDFAGLYKISIDTEIAQAGIVELAPDSTFLLKKVYQDTIIIPLGITDADLDGLVELNFSDPLIVVAGQAFANYEQSHPDSLPNVHQFNHQTWEFGGEVAAETFTELDDDEYIDVIYEGTDSTEQCCHQIFVAEYDPECGNFVRRFNMIPSPDWRISGFAVGDFDDDGYMEFVAGSGSSPSQVYVLENTGNDSYTQVFQDTMSVGNAYVTGATNDIDGNGKIEFFVGGSSAYDGIGATRVYWFEADGDNQYQKIRSFFLLGTDIFGTSELYIHDVNGDGVDDLVFAFSFLVAMLVWDNDAGEFELFYYDVWETSGQDFASINMYDVYEPPGLELFVSVKDVLNTPRIKTFFYRPAVTTGIKTPATTPRGFNLTQNYPNPFNPATNVEFSLSAAAWVELIIFDITGRQVTTVVDEWFPFGGHTVQWGGRDAAGERVASGIYLYRLRAGEFSQTRRMLLIR